MRTYSELKELNTFEERFDYLKLDGTVGEDTFGFDRYLNQSFYRSEEWKQIRDVVIARDLGCDLGCEEFPINKRPLIHHMNPITAKDIKHCSDILIDPEYLITVSHKTHNAIHYGIEPRNEKIVEREPNDTCPWKQ